MLKETNNKWQRLYKEQCNWTDLPAMLILVVNKPWKRKLYVLRLLQVKFREALENIQ